METIWQRMKTEQLNGIPLNDVVGGGEPEGVGRLSREVLQHLGVLTPQSNVLDVGCGCGRTAAALTSYLHSSARYVGVDIIPGLIDFCDREIAAQFPNFSFYPIRQENPQYSGFIASNSEDPCPRDLEFLPSVVSRK